jgi:hypothetical protein
MTTSILATSFYKSITVSATSPGTDADVLYTVPSSFDSEVTLILITNSDATEGSISIQIYHDDDGTYTNLIKSKAVEGNDTYSILMGATLHLHPRDSIVCYMGAGAFDVSLSGRHHFSPMRKL